MLSDRFPAGRPHPAWSAAGSLSENGDQPSLWLVGLGRDPVGDREYLGQGAVTGQGLYWG